MMSNTADHAALVMVSGAARSGKSEWAEYLASVTCRQPVYIATACDYPDDPEWQQRIKLHRARREPHWLTVEEPTQLAQAICTYSNTEYVVLVDSLGSWVANLLTEDDTAWLTYVKELEQALSNSLNTMGNVIFVAEEVGWGVIPAYPEGRMFRDRLGSLVRQLAQLCTQSYLCTGGYVLELSKLGTLLPAKKIRL